MAKSGGLVVYSCRSREAEQGQGVSQRAGRAVYICMAIADFVGFMFLFDVLLAVRRAVVLYRMHLPRLCCTGTVKRDLVTSLYINSDERVRCVLRIKAVAES